MAVAMFREFQLFGLRGNMPNAMAGMIIYGLVAACAVVPGTFSFVVTRGLIRLLARQVTLGRTFGVLSLELVTIKAIVLAFVVILAMGCVVVVMFAVHYQLPAKDGATLLLAFITVVLALDTLVILPATLAVTVIHVSVGLVFLMLHFVAKGSLLVELLLQGIVRTKRVAFASSAAVIAGLIAISHVAAAYLHPIIWFGRFWAWQADIDLIVVRNVTAFCTWLWLKGQ